jgi:signal transduction histidine kinase
LGEPTARLPAGDRPGEQAALAASLLARRNALTAALAAATDRDEVLSALDRALTQLPGVAGGVVLEPGVGGGKAVLHFGSPVDPAVIDAAVVDALEDVGAGGAGRRRQGARGQAPGVLLWPLPRDGGEPVLALVVDGPGPADLVVETAATLAAEAWMALRRLEVADHVTAITHDLQAPLTGLLGFTTTLRHLGAQLEAAERSAYLETMEQQIRRVAGLVDDMLVTARLEAGALRPDAPEPVDLAALAAEVPSLFGPEQRQRIAVRSATPVTVHADRRQLDRALQNLIDNALQHAPPPSPVVVEAASEDERGIVRVIDSGPGIPPEARARLFTRYGRAGRPRRGSTGLGLAIVRGIAEAHGGSITVDSTPGGGTTFTLTLPLARP